jgi:formate hydrogenlyase transcriptional activator
MEIIGESPSLKRALEQVETVAGTDSAVLILGETGTGKEIGRQGYSSAQCATQS